MLNITDSTIIYILCPGNYASGGPDALHQLHYYFKKNGFHTVVSYFGEDQMHERYRVYAPDIVPISTIVDSADHILVVPESDTKHLKYFKHIRKCIWWLSLSFYWGVQIFTDNHSLKRKNIIKQLIPSGLLVFRQLLIKRFLPSKYDGQPYIIRKEDYNLCGSQFAYDFVQKRFNNVELFVEPISLFFLQQDKPLLESKYRGNSVLYNPSKPSKLMTQLLERNDIEFVAIQGLEQDQMVALFRQSKLYVDFGFFGGPERLPKETVYNGTLLLVGRQNAAINNFDIAISDQYKIEDMSDVDQVAHQIKYMLANYDELINDFELFRLKIAHLESNFEKSIQKIFVKV